MVSRLVSIGLFRALLDFTQAACWPFCVAQQQHYSHKGKNTHTRNMQIIEGKPRGDGLASRHLVVAHQDSDTLAAYRLDVASGMVRPPSNPTASLFSMRRSVLAL